MLGLLVAAGGGVRWKLGATSAWQTDEIPLLVRCTGACGHVTNEAEAVRFVPSFYTFHRGAVRSLKAPRYVTALHTTTAFWMNATIHLFGCSALAARAAPLFWSLLIAGTTALAGGVIFRSVLVGCLSGLVAAASPMAAVYGAQARGYAEAMALAPLLLLSLELLRRDPFSWFRGLVVFLCALWLSLTVLTTWVYLVLPVLGAAIVLLPRSMADDRAARACRTVLVLIVLVLVVFMAGYLIERTNYLDYLFRHPLHGSETGGGSWRGIAFLAATARDVLGVGVWFLPAVLFAAWRREAARDRYVIWLLAAGVALPVVLILVKGSAGYVRNVAYVLGLAGIFAGAGLFRVYAGLRNRFRSGWVDAGLLVVAAGFVLRAGLGLERRAQALMPPDWGGASRSVYGAAPSSFSRILCGCLAHHWAINWYADAGAWEQLWNLPIGAEAEVVVGATVGADGQRFVYRHSAHGRGFEERPLPAYLSAKVPGEVRHRVELRRFRGVRVEAESAYQNFQSAGVRSGQGLHGLTLDDFRDEQAPPDRSFRASVDDDVVRSILHAGRVESTGSSYGRVPLSRMEERRGRAEGIRLVLAGVPASSVSVNWSLLWSRAYGAAPELVPFKSVHVDDVEVVPMIVDGSSWPALREVLRAERTACGGDIRVFALSEKPRLRVRPQTPANRGL